MVTTIAGITWILCAGATGYLAFLQLQYAGAGYVDSSTALGFAVLNGFAAVVTLYFGARLLMNATTRLLAWSVGWGALSVVGGVYQIAEGVTADIFVLATLLAGVACVLSYAAYRASRTRARQ